jgi:hypothetical protein
VVNAWALQRQGLRSISDARAEIDVVRIRMETIVAFEPERRSASLCAHDLPLQMQTHGGKWWAIDIRVAGSLPG